MTEWTDHHGIRQQVQIDLAGAEKRVVRLDDLSRYPRRLRYRVVARVQERVQTFRRKNTGPILLEAVPRSGP